MKTNALLGMWLSGLVLASGSLAAEETVGTAATTTAAAATATAKPAEKPAATKASTEPKLPTFTGGDADGLHALYRKPKFEAKVLANGALLVQCLEKGKPVGKPLRVSPTYGYTDSAKKWHARKVSSLTVFPQQPTRAPKKLQIEGELTDGVTFGLVYEFLNNQISASGWVVDPEGITYRTAYSLGCSFSAVKEYAPEVPVAERKKEMAPYSVTVTPVSGKTQKFPYGNVAKGMSSSQVKNVAVQGPVYGLMNKVSVSAFSSAKAPLQVWIYPDFAPYQGYSVALKKIDNASRDPNQKMIIKVD